jgi:peptidoglycan hydrolase CwlO-like protein
MNAMGYVEVILTLLTIVTGCLAIANFFNGRKQASKKDGENDATLRSDLQYIKEVLIDVRRETKEINQLLDKHAERLTKVEEKLKSASERIDHLESRIDKYHD